ELERVESYRDLSEGFAQQVKDQKAQVENLKTALRQLEQKLTEAQAKADLLITQHRRARAVGKAADAHLTHGNGGHAAAFDRMKRKVAHAEAHSHAKAQIAAEDIEDQPMDAALEPAVFCNSPLDWIADWYEAAVPIRVGAAVLAPFTHGVSAIVDQGIVSTFAFLRRARLQAFKNDLTLLNIQPTQDEVRSREFIEAFVATAARVENTKREEKIRLFALLFRCYWNVGVFTPETFDEYEEELAIIDELGYREFIILSILDRLEQQHPLQSGMNRLQQARKI